MYAEDQMTTDAKQVECIQPSLYVLKAFHCRWSRTNTWSSQTGVNDLYRFQIYIKTKLSITKGDSILQFWTANPSYKRNI